MDYEKIGLKVGLEVHQQLNTNKLFCNCPSLLRKDEPDFTIRRKLHAVAGEIGEVDVAAAYQVSLDKNFIYEGYDTTCLVELDEEPPHLINQEALRIVLQIALFLNAKIFSLTQIMRKTVIDGSNTSGFQRTVLMARDGWIDTDSGRVEIESICLEEDSARIIETKDDEAVYRLDRLGVPLIEIATAPDIKDPKQAKEVALYLGNVLRSCNVKRGLGTIRQDVNVSIKRGARVEIKGVQKPELIEKSVEKEAERQFKIIEKKKKVDLEVRKVLHNGETDFLRPMPGAARMYPETDLPLLRISRDLINSIKKNLPKLRSDTEKELKQEGLNEEMIKLLLKGNKVNEFRELLKIVNNPKLIGKILLFYPKEISSKGKISLDKIEDKLPEVVELLKQKKISENHVKDVLRRLVKGEDVNDIISLEKIEDIEEEIHKIIRKKPGLSENAYMGLTMKELKGKISGKEVMEIIKKYIK